MSSKMVGILFAFVMGFAVWCCLSNTTTNTNIPPDWNGDQIGKGGNSSTVSVSVSLYKDEHGAVGNVIHRKMFFCCGCENAAGCVFCCASTYARNGTA